MKGLRGISAAGEQCAVTVLFTDIVGSTQLLGMLGDEAMERCRREHFALLRAAIAAHGGREVKNVGDGLMAVFGCEAGGLACAVAMQTAIAGQDVAGELAVRMRVGVHSGPTIEAEGDHWGATVVVARRLCDLAQAHEILTSDALVARAGVDAALVRDLGPVTLKGFPSQIGVYAAHWDGAPVSRLAVPAPPRVELPASLHRADGVVGRERELEQLDALWRAAAGGEPQLLLVAGEPGIGKTALVAELARRAHAAGAIVLHGRCDEAIAGPLAPVAEALRRLVGALSAQRLRSQLGGWAPDLARLLPELAQAPLEAVPRSTSDPDTDQHSMFQAVSQLLATSARGGAILLALEDLHWADAATIALLEHVATRPSGALAIVATLREGELAPGHPLRDDVEAPIDRLRLEGLDEAAVGALLGADDGVAVAPALARAAHAASGGNPLHASELARAWREAGSILVRARELVLAGRAPSSAGDSDVRGVIDRRVRRLPADTRRVLTLGSVLGRSFAPAQLGQILAADEPGELVGALGRAVDERMLERAGDGERYAFAHALIRQSVYARTATARRARLHRQVADMIEEAAGEGGGEHVPELAYHFARCAQDGRAAKAVEYALRAGWASLELLAHDRGAAHFAAALELLGGGSIPGADRLRCDATIGLGECQARCADASYRETLLDAARQAERLGDGERLARAALANGRGFFSVAGAVDEQRIAMLRASLLALDGEEGAVRARLLAQLAMELSYAGDWSGRVALSDEALAMARRIGDPATLVTVLYQRSVALWGVHGLVRRRAAADEAEPRLGWLADPSLAFHASHQGVHVALADGDLALADRRLAAMGEHAAAAGQPTLAWYERVARSKRALCAGRVREAQALAFEARDAGIAAGQPDARMWWQAQMFCLRLVQGRLADTDYSALPAIAAGHPRLHALYDAQLACMQASHGRHADAHDTLARLMAGDLEDVPPSFAWIAIVALAGHACWQLGDAVRAGTVIAALEPWAQHFVDMGPGWLGSASLYLGLLESTRARPSAAAEHLHRATAMHDRCGSPAFQAHTLIARAELLSHHDLPGDGPRAPQLAAEALRLAHELALPGLVRRAERLVPGPRVR